MEDNRTLKMQGYLKFVLIVYVLTKWNINSFVAAEVINVEETKTLHLPCYHDFNVGDRLDAIAWKMKHHDVESILANYDSGQGLTVNLPEFEGRVDIEFPNGDLRIQNLQRMEANFFKCILVINGHGNDNRDWIKVDVLVPPEKPQIRCSASESGLPGELCSAIKTDQIKALSCSAQSRPAPNIFWVSPENCSINMSVQPSETLPYGLVKEGSVLRNLCEGEYCCLISYDGKGKWKQERVCQKVAREDQRVVPGTSSPLSTPDNWTMYMIIGAVILGIILLIIFLVCCCCWYKRRHGRYPDVCSLPLHHPKGKKYPMMVDINGDGDPETMALTPFLGPNSTRQNQPVFTFVLDQANIDPNVDRVKVTQDIAPGGEKSRQVEIFKKQNSLLGPDFNVPPSIFRRALSNSDVSKIVYKETIDENGRTKRELDIIKSDERENDVESRNDLRAAGSASAYQRQLSIHPSSSESDVRKVRFQRQTTVDSLDNDEVDGFVHLPRASEVNRQQMKYQQSVSVDIDDVD